MGVAAAVRPSPLTQPAFKDVALAILRLNGVRWRVTDAHNIVVAGEALIYKITLDGNMLTM